MWRTKLFMIVGFFGLVAILLIQNSQLVTFRFLAWTIQAPEMAAILVLVGIGFLLGILAATTGKKKKKP
jgi:uncharacterized integral membrane protein